MVGEIDVGFGFLAEHASDIVCRAGLDLTLLYVSPSAFDLLGWDPAEMVGRSLNDFVSAHDALLFSAAAGTPNAPALERAAVVLRMQTNERTYVSMETRRRLLLDDGTGEPREYVILMRRTEDVEVVQTSPAQAADTLAGRFSGLSTRHEFLADLERECSRAHREGSSLSLLRLDFNGFRRFHFLDAHCVGDDCLAKAAATIKGMLRVTDFAARLLAEDLVLLLPLTDAEAAARVANKVRAAISQLRSPRSVDGHLPAPVSIGVATLNARSAGSQRMPEILLLAAEHALRKAHQKEAAALHPAAGPFAQGADWKKRMPGTPPKCA